MNTYLQLKKEERLEIALLVKKGYSMRSIASVLKRSHSTVSREVHRNRVRGLYDPQKAQHKHYVRKKYKRYQSMKIVRNMKLREYIHTHLKKGWSPEQVAGRIAKESGLEKISSPSIYKYVRSVYGRQLEHELSLAKKKRKKKHQQKVTKLEDRLFVDQRPKQAQKRKTSGHWEADFIVSGKGYGNHSLLVLHERKSRYTKITKLSGRTVKNVEDSLVKMTKEIKNTNFSTLTIDNDIAFQKHTQLSTLLKTPIYFTHPYHSWEKGGVENVNRLIRRFVPKGCDIKRYSKKEIKEIEDWLNTTPRKILNFSTPQEVYEERNY